MVHEIQEERVRINFHASFHGTGTRYNVRFTLNRTPLRRHHQALVAPIRSPQRLLFPVSGFEGLERPVVASDLRLGLFNSTIGGNPAQLEAVISILQLKIGAAPFVVFGPSVHICYNVVHPADV